jgi:heme A synthase
VAWRRRVPNRAFILVPFLLICQILLGALNVWLGKHPGLIVAHLTLATILWATVVYAAASLVEVPAGTRRTLQDPGASDTQAVTA